MKGMIEVKTRFGAVWRANVWELLYEKALGDDKGHWIVDPDIIQISIDGVEVPRPETWNRGG